MNRQVLQGVALGGAIVALVMVWVQFMVVPALQSEPSRPGDLPSDRTGQPVAVETESKADNATSDESGGSVTQRTAPALFEQDANEEESSKLANGEASPSDAEARATANRIADELAELVANDAAEPEKVVDLLRELQREAPGQVAEELDIDELERQLAVAARMKDFGEKMRELNAAENTQDRDRAMRLSNKLVTDMMTDPAFEAVDIPEGRLTPDADRETVKISPSWHLRDASQAGTAQEAGR